MGRACSVVDMSSDLGRGVERYQDFHTLGAHTPPPSLAMQPLRRRSVPTANEVGRDAVFKPTGFDESVFVVENRSPLRGPTARGEGTLSPLVVCACDPAFPARRFDIICNILGVPSL